MNRKPSVITTEDNLSREQEEFKRLCMLIAFTDAYADVMRAATTQPFYSHKLKNILNQVEAETDKLSKSWCERFKDIAYTQDWLNLKRIATAYLNAVYMTKVGKVHELLNLLEAYINQEIIITDEEEPENEEQTNN